MSHTDTWTDDECEDWARAQQRASPAEETYAADRAWQARIDQGADAAADLERQWRNK